MGIEYDGSSPRARGTRRVGKRLRKRSDIIPAYAGDAAPLTETRDLTADHPRVCGGRAIASRRRWKGRGSSPRVRGTLAGLIGLPSEDAIIPACAGDARHQGVFRPRRPDHPRVCGGREVDSARDALNIGSSPRVRGTLCPRPSGALSRRIIPACAGDARPLALWSGRRPDHPRVCGGRSGRRMRPISHRGSSPRVRGTLGENVRRYWSEDIIPACAGDASSRPAMNRRVSDHPRVCGGRVPENTRSSPRGGSSPRVRGTQRGASRRPANRRIIPACAGDAAGRITIEAEITDHPRVCGGRVSKPSRRRAISPSSPRVRGTRRRPGGLLLQERIIPACAGDAPFRSSARPGRPDHPRVCGGRFFMSRIASATSGSSPRVRGTLVGRNQRRAAARIIPACAGDAYPARDPAEKPPDHPRVCGGRSAATSETAPITGSSPRVRGTRLPSLAAALCGRIIPACAGDALSAPTVTMLMADHPRVCGGRQVAFGHGDGKRGSSPRVRGTPGRVRPRRRQARIIPACAGDARVDSITVEASGDHPRVCGGRSAFGFAR